jgi:serine protease Do
MLAQLKRRDPRLSSTTRVQVTSLSKVVDSLMKENNAGIKQITLVPDKSALQYALELQKKLSSRIALNSDGFDDKNISNTENRTSSSENITSPIFSKNDTKKVENIDNIPSSRNISKSSLDTTPNSSEDIYKITNEITVSIEGASKNNGSGVLIAKDSDSYYVLTCKHVVAQSDSYTIVTSDGNRHSVNYKNVRLLPEFDLAIVVFTSNQSYRLAQLNSTEQTRQGESIYISGFTSGGQSIKLPTQLTSEGKISGFQKNEPEGYELLYSNVTAPGMSGGPILNANGQVIGIHGRAEGSIASGGKVGINLGIPIKFFLKTAPQVGLDLQRLRLKAEK